MPPDENQASLVLHWAKAGLYFFDPNVGLWSASDPTTAAAELGDKFKGYTFTFGHVLVKA